METIGTSWMWLGFFALVIAMLLMDLFLLGGRKAHRVSLKEAAAWSAFWVALALLFNAALWWLSQQYHWVRTSQYQSNGISHWLFSGKIACG